MKKIESGRSMIEMLGVLAIIGVLSIGGLAGYTMAMNRHKANNALDYAMKCAVIAQTTVENQAIAANTPCNTALYVGEAYPTGSTSITVTRPAATAAAPNPDTTVTITPASTAVAGAIASRVGIGSENSATFTYSVQAAAANTDNHHGWSAAAGNP